MDLQFKIISEFKEKYPNITLKNASKITGIQITRVFRLFNGSEMKLSEYEKFQKLVAEKNLQNGTEDQLLSGLRKREKDELIKISSLLERWSSYRSFNTI